VSNCQKRMGVNHLRPRVSHDFSDLGLHLRLIAVDPTFAAGRLVFSERAFERPLPGKRKKLPTIIAKRFYTMVASAVQVDHHADRVDFPLDSVHVILG
jgi:hypothetical protein